MFSDEWDRVRRLHRAVRIALEANVRSRDFLVGIRVHPLGQQPMLAPVTQLARRVDLWLASLDPDTKDPSRLRTRISEPEVLLEVHAIPKDPEDRTRRARPIVWNSEPLEVIPGGTDPLPPGDGPSAAG